MGVPMSRNRTRSALRSVVAILCAACFLTFAQGAVTQSLAAEAETAETWETWPKKSTDTEASGAAIAGEEGGKKTYAGMSAGTIGWIALGTAAVIGIAVAAGGGGGGSSTPAHTAP
jgi:TRAP-type C4-dicarboxylate transport system permease small subunit